MKNYASLIEHLNLFDENLTKMIESNRLLHPEQREEYANKIAECFIPCAKKILAGCFLVKNLKGGEQVVRKINPTVLELYYHEEDPGRFKDPIMYHTNDRKYYDYYLDANGKEKSHGPQSQSFFKKRGIDGLPYYSIGSLNPHTSGIDITFENSEKHYRASCLIREYDILFAEGKEPVHIKNSTDIYDDLLLYGITLDNADWIDWEPGDCLDSVSDKDFKEKHSCGRRNVPDYIPSDVVIEGCPVLWKKNDHPDGEPAFAGPNKKVYKKCPFNWQFHKAEIPPKK